MSLARATLSPVSPEIAALLLSAVSLLVAGLSLGWQVAQWVLSAARPKAQLMQGVLSAAGGVYLRPVDREGRSADLQQLRGQGIGGPEVIGIRVTNHGRAPLIVERVSVHSRGGSLSLVPISELSGPPLPRRIDPGANESWFVDLEWALTLVQASREVLKERVSGLYMVAELGTGRSVKTANTLRV